MTLRDLQLDIVVDKVDKKDMWQSISKKELEKVDKHQGLRDQLKARSPA